VSTLPGQPRIVGPGGLYFWLFGQVVRIRPSFWLLNLFLALSGGTLDIVSMLLWVVVVTVSVLWHELGHAVVARAFGQNPVIDLHGMGGTTSWTPTRRLRWHERVAISLAGPAVGLVIGVAVLFLVNSGHVPLESRTARISLNYFLWVNIAWGVFNLLPILPLDGGSIMAAILEWRMGPRGMRAARWISVVAGVACLILAFRAGMPWAAVMAALFAYNNYQVLQVQGGSGLPER
jgi:stage IV sporulation protein FB